MAVLDLFHCYPEDVAIILVIIITIIIAATAAPASEALYNVFYFPKTTISTTMPTKSNDYEYCTAIVSIGSHSEAILIESIELCSLIN